MAKLDPLFYNKLLQIAHNVGMKPEDILNVMASESGINPAAHNANGNASGLVQFMPSTLKNLGFKGTHDDFRKLSAIQQLDYVEKFIKSMVKFNGAPLTSATQYYIGNFIPAALKIPGVKNRQPNTVIVSKNPTVPHVPGVSIDRERTFYNANVGLDHDKDGNITYKDISAVLNGASKKPSYQDAVADLQSHTGYEPRKMYEPKIEKTPSRGFLANVENLLDRFLKQVAAMDNKKLYKKYLPRHCATIAIEASNRTNAIEFARILSLALDEELGAIASIHGENQVEVELAISGPEKACFAAVEQLSNSLAEVFKETTSKVGGINIKTKLFTNKTSSYEIIDLNKVEMEHRKFLLKLA